MKNFATAFAMLLLVGQPARMSAEEISYVFARSGQKATFSVGGQEHGEGRFVLLTPTGQRWGEPLKVERGIGDFTAPAVRVPVVFRLASADDIAWIMPWEVVVYPERWLAWDKDKQLSKYQEIQFTAAGVPDWFERWIDAVGFPIEKYSSRESLRGHTWRKLEKSSLLILGRKAAGHDLAEMERLAIEYQTNVLVLEADWFGKWERNETKITVMSKCARAALADLQAQVWPLPPAFQRQAIPWPIVANRLTWLDGPKYPLAEEIVIGHNEIDSPRIVLSYLPWQEQLGRSEMADELLLRVLAEAAKVAQDRRLLEGRWCLLYPDVEKIKADKRPVLAAALKSAERERRARCGYVLDLRGEMARPDELFAESGIVKTIEDRIDKDTPLLILGDNPKLDTWGWLKLDREQGKSLRPGVFWLSDNRLPPSCELQLRMMDIFTQWNVLLTDTLQEKNHESR